LVVTVYFEILVKGLHKRIYAFGFFLIEATLDNSCYTQAGHGIMHRQVYYYEKPSRVSKSHLPCLPSTLVALSSYF